jgi:hypothetical protein
MTIKHLKLNNMTEVIFLIILILES